MNKNGEYHDVLGVIAENIKFQRNKLGLSQEDLAFLAGVDRTFVSKIERKQANPSVKTLICLADALEIPFIQFFYNPKREKND
jgi:transcriptional regulator with XRE-family HTH domain